MQQTLQVVPDRSEQCPGSTEAAEDCTLLWVTSVTFLVLSHTCTHTADHHHMKILSPEIRELQQYLWRKSYRQKQANISQTLRLQSNNFTVQVKLYSKEQAMG